MTIHTPPTDIPPPSKFPGTAFESAGSFTRVSSPPLLVPVQQLPFEHNSSSAPSAFVSTTMNRPSMLSPPTTPPRSILSGSTTYGTPDVSSALTGLSLLSVADTHKGSVSNPYIVTIDRTHPERTEHDFVPLFTPSKLKHNWRRPAYHISKDIHPLDMEKVHAWIPTSGTIRPEYEGRCMMVEWPSLSFLHRNSDLYHESLHCVDTKDSHRGLENAHTERGNNDSRRSKYYLLVFPDQIDNTHFSLSSDGKVETHENTVIVPRAHPKNDLDVDIVTTTAYWEIALAAGGHAVTSTASTPTLSRAERLALKRNAGTPFGTFA